MVKAADDDAQAIDFSPTSSCEAWIRVPLTLIESVEHIGTARCKDHKHNEVIITFKTPTSDEGRVFGALLQAQPTESQILLPGTGVRSDRDPPDRIQRCTVGVCVDAIFRIRGTRRLVVGTGCAARFGNPGIGEAIIAAQDKTGFNGFEVDFVDLAHIFPFKDQC